MMIEITSVLSGNIYNTDFQLLVFLDDDWNLFRARYSVLSSLSVTGLFGWWLKCFDFDNLEEDLPFSYWSFWMMIEIKKNCIGAIWNWRLSVTGLFGWWLKLQSMSIVLSQAVFQLLVFLDDDWNNSFIKFSVTLKYFQLLVFLDDDWNRVYRECSSERYQLSVTGLFGWWLK